MPKLVITTTDSDGTKTGRKLARHRIGHAPVSPRSPCAGNVAARPFVSSP